MAYGIVSFFFLQSTNSFQFIASLEVGANGVPAAPVREDSWAGWRRFSGITNINILSKNRKRIRGSRKSILRKEKNGGRRCPEEQQLQSCVPKGCKGLDKISWNHKWWHNLICHMTQCKIKYTIQSQQAPNFKVVLEWWKLRNTPKILNIYGIPSDFMQNITQNTQQIKQLIFLNNVGSWAQKSPTSGVAFYSIYLWVWHILGGIVGKMHRWCTKVCAIFQACCALFCQYYASTVFFSFCCKIDI